MGRLIVTAMPARLGQPWLPAFGDAATFLPGTLPAGGADAEADAPRIVCFYCAPWDMPECIGHDGPEDLETWLSAWLDFHAAILEAWRASPERLALVNARRSGAPANIARRLGATGFELDPARAPAGARPPLPAWARGLLAGHLAESAPEVWECYEALESCALLTGPMPEFRGSGGLTDMADASAVFRAVAQGLAEPGEARVDPRDLEDVRMRARLLEDQLDALRHENELLTLQAGQLHQEIELADEMRRGVQAKARTLRDPVVGTAERALEGECDALRQENEMLALQVAHLHAELENATGEARLAGQVAERAATLAERARKLLVRLKRTQG